MSRNGYGLEFCSVPRARRSRHLASALLLAAVLAGCAAPPEAGHQPLDARLHEEVHRIPVVAANDSIVMTSFRPRGKGPFPWLVLSHGTATTPVANRAMGRYRPLAPIHEW